MKFRFLFTILALLALTSPSFCQPAVYSFDYPGDGECDSHTPLTYIGCWVGIPIPNETPIIVYINGSPADTVLMNADFGCAGLDGGFFFFDYYLFADPDDTVYLDVTYEDCHYWTNDITLTLGPQTLTLDESDWNCECGSCGPVVISLSNGDVVLNWFPFGGATSYNIYGADEPFVLGDSLDTVADTTWTDTATSSRPSLYFYYVKALE